MGPVVTINIDDFKEHLKTYLSGKYQVDPLKDSHELIISKTLIRSGGEDLIKVIENYLKGKKQ